MSLPSALLGPGLGVVVLAAALSSAIGAASFVRCTLIVGAAVPAAVMARVIVECAIDPTDHSLWPLELMIALVLGLACSGLGAGTGVLIGMLRKSRSRA